MYEGKKENDRFSIQNERTLSQLVGKSFNFSRNCNITSTLVTTEWTLFLNDDCFLEKDTIQNLLLKADENGAGIVGGYLTYPDGRFQSFGNYMNMFQTKFMRVKVLKERVVFVAGALMLVKTDILRHLKFDEYFDFGADDIDFCRRATEAGVKIVFAENAKAVHMSGGSITTLPRRFRRSMSYMKLHKRHPDIVQGNSFLVGLYVLYMTSYEVRLFLLSRRSEVSFSLRRYRDMVWGSPNFSEP